LNDSLNHYVFEYFDAIFDFTVTRDLFETSNRNLLSLIDWNILVSESLQSYLEALHLLQDFEYHRTTDVKEPVHLLVYLQGSFLADHS
jgi:hypothetical protein